MSKEKVYSFKKSTDSYIMYNKQPPKFLFWIGSVIILTIIGVIIWGSLVTKPYVVESTGIAVVENKSTIMIAANARIKEIYVEEGETVQKGDILFEQDSSDIDGQINQIQSNYDYCIGRIELYDRLINYIRNDYLIDDENFHFDKENIDELEFYNYLYNYLQQKKLYDDTNSEIFKNDTINIYLGERQKLVLQHKQYEEQINSYNKTKENYKVVAQNDGIVHFDNKIDKGMYLGAGTSIGSVSAQDSNIIVEIYLRPADRAKVEIGEKVSSTVDGLIQNEYGTVSGTLIEIDTDATYTENGNYYKCIIELDKQYIESKDNKVEFILGMQFNTRIIYEETTYMKYFLEQVGIKFKK